MPTSKINRLASEIAGLKRELRAMRSPQFANSSLEDGFIEEYDEDGVLVQVIGRQYDGTHTVTQVNGGNPPAPVAAVTTSVAGGARIYWDGKFAADALIPMNFSRVTVHATTSPGTFSPLDQATIVGAITTARGGELFASLPAVPYSIFLVTWNHSGKFSAPSVAALVTPGDLDVVPVEDSPTPVVIGGVRLLHVTWEPIPGTAAKVQVHVTTDPFMNAVIDDPATLAGEFQGTGGTIEALPDGSPLVPGTTYYVQLIAYNSISTAPPSSVASGSLRLIDTDDISVEAVWAGTITADRIRAGGLQVTVDLEAGGVVRARGASGQKIEFAGAEGFLVAGPDSLGNPTYIFFPTDGRPNIISGTTQATTLSVDGDPTTGQAATFRRNSQLEPGATLTLNDSIVAPIGAPVAETLSDSSQVSIGTIDFEKALAYRATDHSLYVLNTDGTLYRYDIAANTMTLITTLEYGATAYLPRGIAWLGSHLIVLFEDPGNGALYLSRHDPTLGYAGIASVSLGQPGGHASSEDSQVLATDGTDLWIGLRDGTGGAIRFHRYLGDLSSAVRQETVTTTIVPDEFAGAPPELLSLNVGTMDFGATKFVLTYTETYENTSPRPPSVSKCRIATFSSTGARETSNEFNLMRGTNQEWLAWDSTNSVFIGLSHGTRTRYTNIKLSGKTQSFYVGSTFYRSSDSAETPLSPQTTLTMNSRWRWKGTVSSPPGGLGSRIYIGTTAGAANAKLQATLAVAATTHTGSTYDAAGVAPPVTSTFGSTTPAIVLSQETIDRVISTTTTNGSATMTGTGFAEYLIDKPVSGTGIPAGTTVIAVASTTSLTLSQPATSSATANRTFKLPKLEIRGDGYARITELEKVILSSNTDATVSAGNEPALRVGNVVGNHLRIDGNEILAMDSDTAQGLLSINLNAPTNISGMIKNGTKNCAPAAAGTTYSVSVTFTTAFPSSGPVPNVTVTPEVTSPHQVFASVRNVTRSGFDLYFHRTSGTNAFDVAWQAIATTSGGS